MDDEKPRDSSRMYIGDSLTTSHIDKRLEREPENRSFTTSHLQKAVQQKETQTSQPQGADGAKDTKE